MWPISPRNRFFALLVLLAGFSPIRLLAQDGPAPPEVPAPVDPGALISLLIGANTEHRLMVFSAILLLATTGLAGWIQKKRGKKLSPLAKRLISLVLAICPGTASVLLIPRITWDAAFISIVGIWWMAGGAWSQFAEPILDMILSRSSGKAEKVGADGK